VTVRLRAFRFCVLYFGLYILTTQIFVEMFLGVNGDSGVFPALGTIWPLRQLTIWTAARVFHVTAPLVIDGSGSGDKIFDWVQAFCLLAVALAGTIVWSAVDRTRRHDDGVAKWFHLLVRLALGTTMVAYGMMKVIPTQMPALLLTQLVEPFGHFSPMGVIWATIAAAPAYETATGCAELLGGTLLLIPPTATIGALITLAAMLQVFVLNMTYDVPVKLFSFHLILLAVVLLAPQARRLVDALVLDRAVPQSKARPLFRTGRANTLVLAAQCVFAVYIVVVNFYEVRAGWREYGAGKPKSPLYGIWDVADMTIDGVVHPALLTDLDRWRRVIFDSAGGGDFGGIQRADDTVTYYRARIDSAARTIVLTTRSDSRWTARFSFERPVPSRLLLAGDLNGHAVHLGLTLVDQTRFLLLTRGFHWIQEYPFNR
jgi:hypothetical protein